MSRIQRAAHLGALCVMAVALLVGMGSTAAALNRAPADGLTSTAPSPSPSPVVGDQAGGASAQPVPGSTASAAASGTGGTLTSSAASGTQTSPGSTGASALTGASSSPSASASPTPSSSVPPQPTGYGLSDNELIVAQLDASGLPTTATLYDQLTAVGVPSRTYLNPTGTKDLSYVGQRGAPAVENGEASVTVGGEQSTVTTKSAFGKPLPIGLHVGYSLAGEPVAPSEVGQADDAMVVTYTVTNTTAKDQKVEFKRADGSTHTDTVPVFAPYVGTLRVEVPRDTRIEDAPGGVVVATPEGTMAVTWQLVLYPPLGDYEQQLTLRLSGDEGMSIPAARLEVVPVTDSEDPASSFSADMLAKSTEGSANLADGLGQLNSSTVELAAGAAELASGMAELEAGTYELAAGLDEAYAGSAQLSQAIGALSKGASTVAAGLTQVAESAELRAAQGQLAGASEALNRLSSLFGSAPGGAGAAPDAPGVTLYQLTLAAQQGSAVVAQQTAELSQQLATLAGVELPSVTDQLRQLRAGADVTASDVAAAFSALCNASPLPPGCERLQSAVTGVAAVQQRASQAEAALQGALTRSAEAASQASAAAERASAAAAALAELELKLAAVATALSQGGPSAPGVAANLAGVGRAITAATTALTGLATGATAFAEGFGQLAAGSDELTAGLADAAEGSDQLAAGATQLTDGSEQLAAGAGDLQSQGTSKIYSEVVASSEDPAFASAYLTATYGRTTEAMPYGAPEGAVGRAAYVYDLATPATAQPVNWAVIAAAVLAALALGIISVKRIAGGDAGREVDEGPDGDDTPSRDEEATSSDSDDHADPSRADDQDAGQVDQQ